jgi:signal peptidase II
MGSSAQSGMSAMPPPILPLRAISPLRLGALAAVATLIVDQASKLWLYFGLGLADIQPKRLGPFLDLVLVWNRGISYGLLQQDSEIGRWLLVGVSIAAAIGLSWWMARASGRLVALSIGLIVGGAVGNGIDRVAYGAVLDFVHFHVGSFSWYVFNVADAAIVAGVAGLLYDSLFIERRRTGTVV